MKHPMHIITPGTPVTGEQQQELRENCSHSSPGPEDGETTFRFRAADIRGPVRPHHHRQQPHQGIPLHTPAPLQLPPGPVGMRVPGDNLPPLRAGIHRSQRRLRLHPLRPGRLPPVPAPARGVHGGADTGGHRGREGQRPRGLAPGMPGPRLRPRHLVRASPRGRGQPSVSHHRPDPRRTPGRAPGRRLDLPGRVPHPRKHTGLAGVRNLAEAQTGKTPAHKSVPRKVWHPEETAWNSGPPVRRGSHAR